MGVTLFWFLADDVATAWYLSTSDKALLESRLHREQGHTDINQRLYWVDVRWAFKDWKIWAFCSIIFASNLIFYGYSTFLPTIVSNISTNWSTTDVQALTIPCYALGAISFLFVAWLSDRYQRRGPACVAGGLITTIGYAILLSNSMLGVHYFGCFVVPLGLYFISAIPEAWLAINQPRYGKRTTAVAMQLMSANLGGVVSPFVSYFPPFLCFVEIKFDSFDFAHSCTRRSKAHVT